MEATFASIFPTKSNIDVDRKQQRDALIAMLASHKSLARVNINEDKTTTASTTTKQDSTAVRPKSASMLITAASRKLSMLSTMKSNNNLETKDTKSQHPHPSCNATPSAEDRRRSVMAPTISSRANSNSCDQFCHRHRKPRPRPPSASTTPPSSSRNRRSRFQQSTTTSVSTPTPTPTPTSKPAPPIVSAKKRPASATAKSPPTRTASPPKQYHSPPKAQPAAPRVGMISDRVLKEEIENQREVTRRAHRQFLSLKSELLDRREEIETLRDLIRTIESQLKATHSAKSKQVTSSTQVAGESTGPASADPATQIARLKEQIQRQDAYKKRLKHMQDRLSKHVQFTEANLETLRQRRASADREKKFFEDKVAQQRAACAKLEHKRLQLIEERSVNARQAFVVLDSLREEITSRSLMSQQRQEADQRRQEMLRLVQSRPLGATDGIVGPVTTATTGGRSTAASNEPAKFPAPLAKKDSFKTLCMDTNVAARMAKQANLLGTQVPNANVIPGPATSFPLMHMSSRRLQCFYRPGSSLELLQFHREAFFHVYETQYARLLDETGESDVNVLLERYKTFDQTVKQLESIALDLDDENKELELKKQEHTDLVHKLRFSGTAEVEKRKKIRDYFEQMHHVKTIAKTQAKDAFVHQLKTFSYVQQGIQNIVELLKCLDDRIPPPLSTPPCSSSSSSSSTPPKVSPSMAGTPAASSANATSAMDTLTAANVNVEWLCALIQFCVAVAKQNPAPSITFTEAHVAKLMEIIPDYHMELPMEILVPDSSPATGSTASGRSTSTTTDSAVARPAPSRVTTAERKQSKGTGAKRRTTTGTTISRTVTEDDEDDDSEVVERKRIKQQEAETLQQVETLLKTLDAKQQQQLKGKKQLLVLSHKQHTQASPATSSTTSATSTTTANCLDAAEDDRKEKLDAIHAFFREKRLRERQQELHRKELLSIFAATNGDGQGTTSNTRPRSKAATSSSTTSNAALLKGAARKRSNGVSFILPIQAGGQYAQQDTNIFPLKPSSQSQSSPTQKSPPRKSPVVRKAK